MNWLRSCLAALLAAGIAVPPGLLASSHREAPITALDHKADITDLYAFVSYHANQTPKTTPSKVTLILNVDPLLEPANGPNWFPFDPDILYQIHVDNDHDALADVTFQIRFQTQFQLPNIPVGLAGIGDNGANQPGTSNLGGPPAVRDVNNPGLNLRQPYTVTMIRHTKGEKEDDADGQADDTQSIQLANSDGSPFFAVPTNNGPRTMDYGKLFEAGTYHLENGVSVFAGTVDDPFFIDLGATFDSLNFRNGSSFLGTGGVLTAHQDQNDAQNYAADSLSGFNVNTIALQVPISMVAKSATSPVIGTWAATY